MRFPAVIVSAFAMGKIECRDENLDGASKEEFRAKATVARFSRNEAFSVAGRLSRENIALLSAESIRLKKSAYFSSVFFSPSLLASSLLSLVLPPSRSLQLVKRSARILTGSRCRTVRPAAAIFQRDYESPYSSSIRAKCRTNRPGSTAKTINPGVTRTIC